MMVPKGIARMIHAIKLLCISLALLMCAAQDEAVVDEEFTAQNKEQDDAGDDVGGILIQRVCRSDLGCAALQKDEQEGDQRHIEGVELGQPGHNYGGEAAHKNPLFMKTNYILAAAWGVLYVLTAVWTFLLKKAGVGAALIVVNNLMPVLMGIFTGWFEKWYPARLARGSKKQ